MKREENLLKILNDLELLYTDLNRLILEYDEKEFKYVSNFDTNGIFYFLGTNEGKNSWNNPFTLGVVDVLCSYDSGWYPISDGRAQPSNGRNDFNIFFERPSSSTWCSKPWEKDSFAIVDLMKYQLLLTNVTLACQYFPHTELVRFTISGSNDQKIWDILLTQGSTAASNPTTWTIPTDKKTSYRYFKFAKTNGYQFLCSGIEMYGYLSKIE